MLLFLLLVVSPGASPPSSSPLPSFPSSSSVDDVWLWWRSSIPYILLLTLLIILLTTLTLHLLSSPSSSSSSSSSPSSLLHKYRYRHDGYLSYDPSRCSLPPSATISSFHPFPPSTRKLRTVHLHPLPRPGNALPPPTHPHPHPTPRAVLLWLPPLHSHALHSSSLLSHVAYIGDAVVAVDWGLDGGGGKGEVDKEGGKAGGRGGQGRGGEGWKWEGVVEEVGECAEEVQRGLPPGVPLFIGGESFGAAIAMAATLKRPHLYKGMVSVAE